MVLLEASWSEEGQGLRLGLVGFVALLAIIFDRGKKRRGWGSFLVLLGIGLALGCAGTFLFMRFVVG